MYAKVIHTSVLELSSTGAYCGLVVGIVTEADRACITVEMPELELSKNAGFTSKTTVSKTEALN